MFARLRQLAFTKAFSRPPPPPIEMLSMIKMPQKILLFLQFQHLLATSRTTVINNNIDPGARVPSI